MDIWTKIINNMDLRITITSELKDDFWGFSDLLNGRELNDETKAEITELIYEDLMALFDNCTWNIQQLKP